VNGLLLYQIEPFERLRDGFKKGLQCQVDFSDTGTGKTYVAAAVAADLRLPVLVVCPYSVRSSWAAAFAHFNDEASIINYESLITGHSGFGCWENQAVVDQRRPSLLVCTICQKKFRTDLELGPPCQYHPFGVHCVERKTQSIDYGKFLWHSGVQNIFFDEVHRCSGIDSLNAELLIAAKAGSRRILGISATAAWSPLKMRALGFALDLHGDNSPLLAKRGVFTYERAPDFFKWSRQFGCRRHPQFRGWHWFAGESEQREIMGKIRDSILPARGVRVAVSDIPGFPKVSVHPGLFDLPAIPDRATEESLATLDERAGDPELQSAVTQRLRARQRSELLAVSTIADLAQDKLDAGLSVAIFVNFAQTLDELGKRLGVTAFLDGRTTGADRDRIIGEFVVNRTRLVLGNSAACGVSVGLHDKGSGLPDGNEPLCPRYGIVVPGEDAVIFSQVLGRLPRQGGRSHSIYQIFLVAGIQEKVYKNLVRKNANIEALRSSVTDADLTA
jgi:hypothetical protein